MEKSTTQLTPRGLERRIKQHLLRLPQTFFAVCPVGFEAILTREISALPEATITTQTRGGIEFSGPLELVYHANLHLRSASRILLRIDSFTARSYPELYHKSRRIPWERFIGFNQNVSFEVSARESRIHHTGQIERSVQSGLQESMAEQGVKVVNKSEAPLRVCVRLADDICTISLDSSGELLHKRGYRKENAQAPLRENIAAALLLQSDWQRFSTIADPFCGSGTFLIEAALLASATPPGSRREFAFSSWPAFQKDRWERLRQAKPEQQAAAIQRKLLGADISSRAIQAASANAERAGILPLIQYSTADALNFNQDQSAGPAGLILSNLPYGTRVGEKEELVGLFQQFGQILQTRCRGWHFGLIIADRQHEQALGLKVSQRLPFTNGGIAVLFIQGKIS